MKLSSILRWPYWKFRQPWPDHVRQFDYLDWETQRRLAYQQIDKGKFGFWTVFVAGAGFLTDAYDIFAVNTVLPMLGLVYWNNSIPQKDNVLISLSLLVGTMFGQFLFGILGDRYGRRRLYGYELLILTFATILMSIVSKGALRSSNKLAWIIAWRFFMGIGIGGDYPLSATIVAEFAPRKHRGQMLSALFYMQATGALIANIVTVIAVVALKEYLPTSSATCDASCIRTVDTCWRWIVGLGAVPPALATLIRWWIPESPRYTMEVEKDPHRASEDVQKYFQTVEPLLMSPRSGPGHHDGTLVGSTPPQSMRRPSSPGEPTLTFGEHMQLKDFSLSEPAIPIPIPSKPVMRKETWNEYWTGFWKFLITDGNWTDLLGTSLAWMILDFAFYFLSVNNPKILNKVWNSENSNLSVYETLLQNGYRALIAVSTGQMMGGAIFITMARYRWQLQYYGFWMLSGAFVVVGVCFVTLLGTRYFAAVIVLYSMNSLFFDLGPNTSTFVIAAEVFPTKYRASCHGIAAAAGKLGSIVAQIFLTYAQFGGVDVNEPHSTWLGWVLLVFTVLMGLGALITRVWVPNPVDIWGHSRSLEDLGLGKNERKRMEKEELDHWRAFAPRSPNA